jgi:hypothetical protein
MNYVNCKNILALSIMIASVFPLVLQANAESVSTSVTIGTTCGIQFVPTDGMISYGEILPGDTTAEQKFTVLNPGNVPAQIKVSGTNWVDSSNANQMNANNTKYSVTTAEYSAKTGLSTTASIIFSSLAPQTNTDTFWQLETNLIDSLFSGALTQTLDFSSSC